MIYRVKIFPLKFYKIKLHNMFFISHLSTTAFFPLFHYYKKQSCCPPPLPTEKEKPQTTLIHAQQKGKEGP